MRLNGQCRKGKVWLCCFGGLYQCPCSDSYCSEDGKASREDGDRHLGPRSAACMTLERHPIMMSS